MAAFYQKFLRKHLDLSSLSVMRREDNDPYFCTPKGASIFGWAGVDGIHFCFVRGFGETVFAVSPMNGGKDCVHVIARDFSDFLRLLLATGDSAALEQAWQWDEAQFDAFLAENPDAELLDFGGGFRLKLLDTSQEFIDFVSHILIVFLFCLFLNDIVVTCKVIKKLRYVA